jgi:hypothetical protein
VATSKSPKWLGVGNRGARRPGRALLHHDSGRYSGATSIVDIEKLMAHPARHREQAGKI